MCSLKNECPFHHLLYSICKSHRITESQTICRWSTINTISLHSSIFVRWNEIVICRVNSLYSNRVETLHLLFQNKCYSLWWLLSNIQHNIYENSFILQSTIFQINSMFSYSNSNDDIIHNSFLLSQQSLLRWSVIFVLVQKITHQKWGFASKLSRFPCIRSVFESTILFDFLNFLAFYSDKLVFPFNILLKYWCVLYINIYLILWTLYSANWFCFVAKIIYFSSRLFF